MPSFLDFPEDYEIPKNEVKLKKIMINEPDEPGYIMRNDPYYYWKNYYNSIIEYRI